MDHLDCVIIFDDRCASMMIIGMTTRSLPRSQCHPQRCLHSRSYDSSTRATRFIALWLDVLIDLAVDIESRELARAPVLDGFSTSCVAPLWTVPGKLPIADLSIRGP